MLERMYQYYWEQMRWKVEEISRTPGTEVTLRLDVEWNGDDGTFPM